MSKRLLLLKPIPTSKDAGLLALRVLVAATMLLRHGLEKFSHFSAMAAHFPNPLHIGATPSLMFATLADGICSVLLILGLATRWAALIEIVNLFVAWSLVLHFAFFGRTGGEGELVVLYLGAMVALFLMGPGKYSLDGPSGK